MMDFFLFNATIWLGGIVILCIISAVVSNPIPAICGGIFAIAMFVAAIKLYGKGVEVTTKPDDVFQDKDGNFVLKGNGHTVCLKEYCEGLWWTYDLVDKKYIKPTTCKEDRNVYKSLNKCAIRDYKHMLAINGYQSKAWEKYNESRLLYDVLHSQEVFTAHYDIESDEEMKQRSIRSSVGRDSVREIFYGLKECTVDPILQGYYERNPTKLQDTISNGKVKIKNVVDRYKKMSAENEVYTA